MKFAGKQWGAIVLSLVLLAGAAADRVSLISPIDPAPYHRHVRQVAASLSANFGDWIGKDVPVPPEATQQLHPNIILSRQYSNAVTGQYAALLLVQCWDVRDLVPHFPPVCYPGRGLTLTSTRPMDWRAARLNVTGTEYQFESNTFQTSKLTIVDNFMILPSGRICRDMTEVRKQVGLRTRYFGAAQVQLVFDSDISPDQRRKVCRQFIEAYAPLINAIRSGVH